MLLVADDLSEVVFGAFAYHHEFSPYLSSLTLSMGACLFLSVKMMETLCDALADSSMHLGLACAQKSACGPEI